MYVLIFNGIRDIFFAIPLKILRVFVLSSTYWNSFAMRLIIFSGKFTSKIRGTGNSLMELFERFSFLSSLLSCEIQSEVIFIRNIFRNRCLFFTKRLTIFPSPVYHHTTLHSSLPCPFHQDHEFSPWSSLGVFSL